LLGAAIGYAVALVLGGTSAAGRSYDGVFVQGVDLSKVASAPWFGLPAFVHPAFDLRAASLIVPVCIILIAENTGHVKAVEAMTNRKLIPWLGRAFIGDGVATIASSLGGGTGVTTYAEKHRRDGVMIFVIAALVAILLGLSPKFGALVGSIPTGVIGGVVTVLFGLIAITGARIWVDNRVDFTRGVNVLIAAVVVIVGAADYTVSIGDFQLGGIGLGTFGAIVLYQLFKDAAGGVEAASTAGA
jgi:xanthine/uracil permease